MGKIIFSLLVIFIFFSIISSSVEAVTKVVTEVKTEASGSNASAYSEVTTVINGKETKAESSQSGTIRVEVNENKVKVETAPVGSSMVAISVPASTPNFNEPRKENGNLTEKVRQRMFFFWKKSFREYKDFGPGGLKLDKLGPIIVIYDSLPDCSLAGFKMAQKTKVFNNGLIKDISQALEELKGWGSIEVFVQNSKVTQITKRAIKKTNHSLKNPS